MKLSKLAFSVVLALTVTACTTGNMSNDGSLQKHKRLIKAMMKSQNNIKLMSNGGKVIAMRN